MPLELAAELSLAGIGQRDSPVDTLLVGAGMWVVGHGVDTLIVVESIVDLAVQWV